MVMYIPDPLTIQGSQTHSSTPMWPKLATIKMHQRGFFHLFFSPTTHWISEEYGLVRCFCPLLHHWLVGSQWRNPHRREGRVPLRSDWSRSWWLQPGGSTDRRPTTIINEVTLRNKSPVFLFTQIFYQCHYEYFMTGLGSEPMRNPGCGLSPAPQETGAASFTQTEHEWGFALHRII